MENIGKPEEKVKHTPSVKRKDLGQGEFYFQINRVKEKKLSNYVY